MPTNNNPNTNNQEKESMNPMHNYTHYVFAVSGPRELQTIPAAEKEEKLNNQVAVFTKVKAAESFINVICMRVSGNRLVVTIICGMAEGFDKICLIAAFQVGLNVHLAIPSKSYGSYYWGKNSLTGKNQYHQFEVYVNMAEAQTICKKNVTYIMEDVHGITKGLYLPNGTPKGRHANFVRNDWMVSKADMFFIYEPNKNDQGFYVGGTADLLHSVKRAGMAYMAYIRNANAWFYESGKNETQDKAY